MDVCYSVGMSEMKAAFETRAVAHSRGTMALHREARWRNGVTDVDVAAVFYVMEADGVEFTVSATGMWRPVTGWHGYLLDHMKAKATPAIREMIRTGLARVWTDPDGRAHLMPARVHLRDTACADLTACRDSVEGMKGGRVRTVDDLALVDCLECEDAVAKGGPRGL